MTARPAATWRPATASMAMPGSSARRLGIPSTMMESPTAVTSPPPCAGNRAGPGWADEEGTGWDGDGEAGWEGDGEAGWDGDGEAGDSVGLVVETGISELDATPRAVQAPAT